MAAQFSIHSTLAGIPHLEKIAVGLALFHDTGKYANFLGHAGGFEQNHKASNSQLHKIHIALYQSDWTLNTWQNRGGYHRTSDNFVIYNSTLLF